MSDPRNKFTQPDDDTPFGRHLKEVTKNLDMGLPSFTGTFTTTLPEEERWRIKVCVPGRTFAPTTEPIEFTFDAPTWSLGKSMAAHITFGRICEVYNKYLEDTVYQICGHRDEQWEMIRTRKDGSIAAYIEEMDQHIRQYENQMCAIMKKTKKVMTRNNELEDKLKATRDGYEEEIVVLLEQYEDLKKRLGVAEVKPEHEVNIHEDDYIILDDIDSDDEDEDSDDEENNDEEEDSDDDAGDDDYEPMESSIDQNF
nr:protein SDA1 homolog [Aegilops tauschii subsp. strangulata]